MCGSGDFADTACWCINRRGTTVLCGVHRCAVTETVPAAHSGHACVSSAGHGHKQLNSCSIELPVVVIQEGDGPVHHLSIRSPHTLEADCVGRDAVQLSAPVHSPEQRQSSSRGNRRSSLASDEHCMCIVHQEQHLEPDMEGVALLHGADKPPPSDAQSHTPADSQAHLGEPAAPAQAARLGLVDRAQRWWSAVTQHDKLLALRQMLMMGSVAGTASGVMAGLTGMGGECVLLHVAIGSINGIDACLNPYRMPLVAMTTAAAHHHCDTTTRTLCFHTHLQVRPSC